MPPQDDIWPPSTTHPYFARAAAHRFRPKANVFRRENAAWLADMSLLVYSHDEAFVAEKLGAVGLGANARFFGFGPFDVGTQAFVTWDDRAVFVTFRGTEVRGEDRLFDVIVDWLTDALVFVVPIGGGAFAHVGFLLAINAVWPRVLRQLRAVAAGRRVYFTGHSLGAACATLAAFLYAREGGEVQALYTFGSPRVGTIGFAEAFGALGVRAFRVVNGCDVVASVPGLGPSAAIVYRHVGDLKRLGAGGTIEAGAAEAVVATRVELVGAVAAAPAGCLPISDHAPVTYARRLWEALGGG